MHATRLLEIACFNCESALIAQSAGADRIELCLNYKEGGISPPQELIKEVREKIQLPIHVMIRPRAGDFFYSKEEIEKMEQIILYCKNTRINGVVIGLLTKNKTIDVKACKNLTELSRPMSVTFHRAIDESMNIYDSIHNLINMGIERVLTSGGKSMALNAINQLTDLQNKFGSKINIMPAGGVRSSNLKQILSSGCKEYHSAALIANTNLVDAEEIKKMKRILSGV
jgi:copper homeostasis protein